MRGLLVSHGNERSTSPQLEEMVRAKVASGLYISASEVVREALRLMEGQDRLRATRVEQLRDNVRRGSIADQANLGMRQTLNAGRVHVVAAKSDVDASDHAGGSGYLQYLGPYRGRQPHRC